MIHTDIQTYNNKLETNDKAICDALAKLINEQLPETENKIWHAHPVWFLDGNPIVGYSKQKPGIRLMFWSGADFDEEDRKSTRLNSSHVKISYAVFCLKKKT